MYGYESGDDSYVREDPSGIWSSMSSSLTRPAALRSVTISCEENSPEASPCWRW